MITLPIARHNLFGLLELDRAGTVLYSRPDGGQRQETPDGICGSNFYTEVASFENVEEFRERLGRFEQDGNPAESFTFDCRFADGVVAVRVLLARMRRRADGGREDSLLVHIRKV